MSPVVAELVRKTIRMGVLRLPPLKLVGARLAVNACTSLRGEIEIEDGRIRSLALEGGNKRVGARPRSQSRTLTVDLTGFLILPGLVNAHDHLEFNLFPRLGQGPYVNSDHWARHIYQPDRSPVQEHLAVPKPVRLWWGGIKNLLSGATSVCHHNPYVPEVFEQNFPVRVVKRYGWAHSISLETKIPGAFGRTPRNAPFIIHLGEGTDEESQNEIFVLDRLGALDSRTVIVHGVGLTGAGLTLLKLRRAALVWCPTSNLFTLGTTLDPQTVSESGRIALGNDSALTASGDLLDEVRAAYRLGSSAERIYEMVTSLPADVLMLRDGEGALSTGGSADLIAIKDAGGTPASVLVESSFRNVELAISAGQPQLVSEALAARCPEELLEGLEPLDVEKTTRLIRAPIEWLFDTTKEQIGAEIHLAGKRVRR